MYNDTLAWYVLLYFKKHPKGRKPYIHFRHRSAFIPSWFFFVYIIVAKTTKMADVIKKVVVTIFELCARKSLEISIYHHWPSSLFLFFILVFTSIARSSTRSTWCDVTKNTWFNVNQSAHVRTNLIKLFAMTSSI